METIEFGQKQPIHIAIRSLIHDYPQDEGILKELIQNADDGGASEIRFILDRRVTKQIEGPLSRWSDFANESLIVTNDCAFSEADIENIQHISDSDKINRPGQTGRYGRGFNAVYNLTDTPLLLTGSKLLLFDPCQFFVEKGESGKGWKLSDTEWSKTFPEALSIFEGGGYVRGCINYEGSIFRFPLRQKLNGNDKKDRITEQKFNPESFTKLVDGLGKLAEQILLYLRNIKFIGCYELSSDGKDLSPLLEIITNNPGEVDAGRKIMHSFVDQCSGVDELLNMISELDDGCYEAVFQHNVTVRCKNRNEHISWLVCSGLYAGDGGELVNCARRLNESGNKAVPFAGAAICLEKNGRSLPEIEGRVSCFLPLSGVLGSSKVGFSINAAFDLDGSRTAITKEREGSYGATTIRAEWNELLVIHAISNALATVLESIEIPDVNTMRTLYRLFPLAKAPLLKPFDNLAVSFLKQVANLSVFRIADGTCVPLKDIRLIEDDLYLQEALCLEGLPIPEPRLPNNLVSSFKAAGVEINELLLKDVYQAFICEDPVECLPAEFEKESLRTTERIAAVLRFFVKKGCDDFKMLPLAFCSDGYLRTFPAEGSAELYIGTDRHRRIFDRFPEWFLDPTFVENTGIRNFAADGFTDMDLTDLLTAVPKILADFKTGTFRWNSIGKESPNTGWLIDIFKELLDDPEYAQTENGRALLQKTPLIPAEDGQLYPPGLTSTPLLVANSEASLVDLLDSLGVRHFVLRPNNSLTSVISLFKEKIELVWPLTPCDLIDSLGSRLDDNPAHGDVWNNEKVVSRLIAFLSKADINEDESRRNERKQILRSLPIWKDVKGNAGPLNEKCYLEGQFTAPELKSAVRIMAVGDQLSLLQKLDVTKISRSELLYKHYLLNIVAFSRDDLFALTNWLRDEWGNLAKEHSEGSPGLLRFICNLPILLDEQDLRARPKDLYLNKAADLAKEVLGKDVRIPSPTRYNENPELWSEFFLRLGVLSSPSAQHLVNFIESVLHASMGKLPDVLDERSLVKVLGHVGENWESLYAEKVVTKDHGNCSFHTFISETHIIPAYRDKDAANQFGAWKEPETRLFQPRELVPFTLAKSVASVLPIAPRNVLDFTLRARDLLGIVRLPPAQVVSAHLRNVASRYGVEQLSPDDFLKMSEVLTSILQSLGELEKDAENDKDGSRMAELLESCNELSDVACLPDPILKCLRLPRDLYHSCANNISPIKGKVTGKNDAIERGMKLLGRLDRPGIADIVDSMLRLRDRGTILSESELKAVLACLRHLAELLAESPPNKSFDLALPNAEGAMLDPEDLIWCDDPLLSEQLCIDAHIRLHQDAPSSLLPFLLVPSLSHAEASPYGELSISNNPILIKRCKEIGNLLRSPEFFEALDRIAKTEQRLLSKGNLGWLEHVEVDAYREVNCAYEITMSSGRKISIGSAKTDVAYVPLGRGGKFFVAESALQADLLENHFARELRRQLDSEAPRSDQGIGAFQSMLSKSPESLHMVLDKLRFLRLGQLITEDNEVVADVQSDVFGDEYLTIDNGEFQNKLDKEAEKENDGNVFTEQGDDKGDAPTEKCENDEEHDEEEDESGDEEANPNKVGSIGSIGIGSVTETVRSPRTHGNGMPRGRMTQGNEKPRGDSSRPLIKPRQQDGFWISRPKTDRQEQEQRAAGDYHNDEDEDGNRLKIGDLAVGWVLQYEHTQGRHAISMAHANPGYDIESRKGSNVERYIEVKGIDGEWGRNGVALSSIQFFRSLHPEHGQPYNKQPLHDRFWLYVVEHARDPSKVRIHMIKNPAALATQFRFDCGWRDAGSESKNFVPLEPKKGMRLYKILDEGGYDEGVITRVDDNNYLMVKFGDGSAKTVVYDSTRHLLVKS